MTDKPTITSNIDEQMRKLAGALKLRFDRLGGSKSAILKNQAGLLWRTLINISFPNNPSKSRQRIETSVERRFHEMSEEESARMYGDEAKQGHLAVRWTGASSHALYGVAKDVDFTNASLQALEALYWGRGTVQRTGARAKYRRGHGQQDVYVWQKISTKKETVQQLIRKFKSHVGRLKGGWVSAWQACGAPGEQVPGWILMNARAGNKGFEDNLSDPQRPSFVAINRERGAGMLARSGKIAAALRIRAQACVRSLALALHAKGESLDIE